MMNFAKSAFGGAFLAFALVAQPAIATTFLSGGIASQASYTFGSGGTSDPKSATLTAPGSVAVSSASGFVGSEPQVSIASSVNASWASANAGSIEAAWSWNVNTWSDPQDLWFNTFAQSWSYKFVASGDGVFTMNYSLGATGHYPQFLAGFVGNGGLGSALFGSAYAVSGTRIVPLTAGQNYTLSLSNGGNAGNGGPLWLVSNATGRFDWTITYNTVPEPASWAMMIGGMALVGAAMRRRGKLATLTA